jgi:hypothetical protein
MLTIKELNTRCSKKPDTSMPPRDSGSTSDNQRPYAIFFTLVLLMSTILTMVAVPEASADNSTSSASTLSTGYSNEYVCENEDFDWCDSGNYGSGVDEVDYWKVTLYQGDELIVTIYNYCNPHMSSITLRYYTPGVGWDSTQQADCDVSKQVSRTVSGSTYGTFYFEVRGLDTWGGDATDYYIHLYLDTTYRDRDNDGYDDRDDDCYTTYGTSYRGSYQGCSDSDGDGWANLEDDFPNDSSEWNDYDGDGYGDNEDQFPYDPSEWADSDNDGVGDNEDTFPNDASEQRDSDGDGIGDNSDPTPYGGQGISDADGDGIRDQDDDCPNTPSGQSVDSNGCAPNQKDTDNDGVVDTNDDCPNTSSGQSVDSNGCAPNQKDTDNDGVVDTNDDCDNTPYGTEVDYRGCAVEINPEDLIEDYAPTLRFDSRESYFPIDRHWDDIYVSNNWESYSSNSHQRTTYTNVIEKQNHYVFEYWYYYVDSQPTAYMSYWTGLGWHEHDFEYVFVWVEKDTLDPFYMATSQHYWINEYYIDSVDDIRVKVEYGGHGMIHSPSNWHHYADGGGEILYPSEQTFKPLVASANDVQTGGFLNGDSCYKVYQCQAPWYQDVFDNPDQIYNNGVKGTHTHSVLWGSIVAQLNSPAEHYIVDSTGNKTGIVNGEVVEEIPFSWYDVENEQVIILGGLEDYQVVVNGLEDGVYGLNVWDFTENETVEFNGSAIPTNVNESHTFTLNSTQLSEGNDGVEIQIDSNGNGTIDKVIYTNNSLSGDEFVALQTPEDIEELSDDKESINKAKASSGSLDGALLASIFGGIIFLLLVIVFVTRSRSGRDGSKNMPDLPDAGHTSPNGLHPTAPMTMLSSPVVNSPMMVNYHPNQMMQTGNFMQPQIPQVQNMVPMGTPGMIAHGKQCLVCGINNHPDAKDCVHCWSSIG